MKEILREAEDENNFVRIDMEGSDYTERTLRIYEELRKSFENVGCVIQSYLRRSEDDIRRLLPLSPNIRLCKGAYKEPKEKAFPRKSDVDKNYLRLTEILLSFPKREGLRSEEAGKSGTYLAVATHDETIINYVKDFTRKNNIARDSFEFQMLYGIRRDLQLSLSDEGYRIRVYVPYGREWFPYFMRRLAERPANLLFLVKNILRR